MSDVFDIPTQQTNDSRITALEQGSAVTPPNLAFGVVQQMPFRWVDGRTIYRFGSQQAQGIATNTALLSSNAVYTFTTPGNGPMSLGLAQGACYWNEFSYPPFGDSYGGFSIPYIRFSAGGAMNLALHSPSIVNLATSATSSTNSIQVWIHNYSTSYQTFVWYAFLYYVHR